MVEPRPLHDRQQLAVRALRRGLGGDVERATVLARRVRTEQIAVNGCIPGDAPFGGFNQSGLGREGGGLPGLHSYMEPKAIGIPAR